MSLWFLLLESNIIQTSPFFQPHCIQCRQAELGIGDCGGLRYLPGLTQNGKQETPQWLADLLGVEVPQQPQATKGKTLQELIRPEGGGEALN